MKSIVFRLVTVTAICFLLALLLYQINPTFSDSAAEAIMKKLGYSEEKIYDSATGLYLIGATIMVLGVPLFVASFFTRNILPFISVTIVTLFATTLITTPFEWNMEQLFSMYAKVTAFNFIVICLLPSNDKFIGRLKAVIELPLVYGTYLYFLLGLGLWFAGGIFSMMFTINKENWEGETPATIYAFTNAWIYLLGFIIFILIYNIVKFLSKSDTISISDLSVDFSDLKSVKECIGHPFIFFTLFVMTLHRFIFYAPMNPLFEGLLERGWGFF